MKRLAILLIKIYKLAISPYWPGQCQYQPTCSDYAREAIEIHGLWRGASLAARRIARCHPGYEGGSDPVPDPYADRPGEPTPQGR